MQLLQRPLEHHHREDAGAGRHVGGAAGDGVGGHHARAGVALRRRGDGARLQHAGRVEQPCALGGQRTRRASGGQHGGKDVGGLPGVALVGDEVVELGEHRLIEGAAGGVDREHAGGVADPGDPLAGQAPVHVDGERGQEVDVGDVGLVAEDGLVEVRDGPALRDVVLEECGEHPGRLAGDGVLPGAERHEERSGLVEGQVAVHHRGDAEGADALKGHAVGGGHVGGEVRVRGPQARPDGVVVVGPLAVDELRLPLESAGGERLLIGADQHGLDPGGPELDTECGVPRDDDVARRVDLIHPDLQ